MLIFHGSVGRVRQHFADQFEADGDGYLYRRFSKGAPIRVSASERDAYVEAFARALKRSIWVVVGTAVVLGVGLGFWPILSKGPDAPDWVAKVAMAAVVGALGLGLWRTYTAPTHDLRHRLPVGRERTGDDMQRVTLARMGWGKFALGAIAAVVVIGLKIGEWRTTQGQLWIAFGVVMLGVFAVQGLRKWRYGRDAAGPGR